MLFSSVAPSRPRRKHFANAQADTIRLKLLKIAAQVRVTARRIWVLYSCAYPFRLVARDGHRDHRDAW